MEDVENRIDVDVMQLDSNHIDLHNNNSIHLNTTNATGYSIYEPHYQQMHPLIYYDTDVQAAHQVGNHLHHLHHHHHPWEPQEHFVQLPITNQSANSELTNINNNKEPVVVEMKRRRKRRRASREKEKEEEDDGDDVKKEKEEHEENKEELEDKKMLPSRELHNEIERKRRSRIKNCCEYLRTIVPGATDKTDKATVLELTVTYLSHLESCPDFKCKCIISMQ